MLLAVKSNPKRVAAASRPVVCILVAMLALFCVGPTLAAITPSTADCTADASCSPSTCADVTNSACTFTDPNLDWPTLIGGVGCKQCTQSTDARCSSANLASTLDTSATSSVKAAYCNADFLIVWAKGQPAHTEYLDAVPRPPGGGGGSGGYASECVTRTTIPQSQTYKIPLTPPADGDGSTWNFPPAGATGVTVTGVPMYPGLDNRAFWVWDVCEASKCNAHVGRGGDYHYHGDMYGRDCMYTASDYTGNDPHSKVLGYALDGYTVYGRYTAAGQPGIDTDLDDCGGHSHGALGYHYHPHVDTRTGVAGSPAGTTTYTAYYLSPKKCFKGDVSKISNYYAGSAYNPNEENSGQPNYDNSLTTPRYSVSSRNDYEDLRPCCSMTQYYNVSGISFDTSGQDNAAPGVTSPSGLAVAAVIAVTGYVGLMQVRH